MYILFIYTLIYYLYINTSEFSFLFLRCLFIFHLTVFTQKGVAIASDYLRVIQENVTLKA